MAQEIKSSKLQDEVMELLEETFERVRGIYLDKGTSLFETLADVSPDQASGRASARSGSIAAHVAHTSFYLRTLQTALRGESVGKVDWRQIWENDRPVTRVEWKERIEELRAEHGKVIELVRDPATWEREEALGNCMAIVAHTAYHLGAVRQALHVIRAS